MLDNSCVRNRDRTGKRLEGWRRFWNNPHLLNSLTSFLLDVEVEANTHTRPERPHGIRTQFLHGRGSKQEGRDWGRYDKTLSALTSTISQGQSGDHSGSDELFFPFTVRRKGQPPIKVIQLLLTMNTTPMKALSIMRSWREKKLIIQPLSSFWVGRWTGWWWAEVMDLVSWRVEEHYSWFSRPRKYRLPGAFLAEFGVCMEREKWNARYR